MSDLIERFRELPTSNNKLRDEVADEIEHLTAELKHSVDKDQHNAIVRQKNEHIAKLEAVIKDTTEYGEVAFMGVNIPFKQFRLLKEALQEVETDECRHGSTGVITAEGETGTTGG